MQRSDTMELKGSVINFLGDSITEGVGASCRENGFVDVLRRQYGLKAANNYGISGARIARQQEMTENRSDRDYCMRVSEMDRNADAVVVFGGTNDYGHGQAPLGVWEDRDPHTFYGACHFLMDSLLTLYTGKPVLIVTPLHRLNEDDPRGDGKPLSVAPLKTYYEILLRCAAYYALPVLDLYATSGIQPQNAICRQRLCPDGLHPSDEGHRLIARRIAQALKEL